MKVFNNYQTINDKDGRLIFVVIPYADFVHFQGYVTKDGVSILLTQVEMAKRMRIMQAGYAQIESSKDRAKLLWRKPQQQWV